jgi:hypothetical protein
MKIKNKSKSKFALMPKQHGIKMCGYVEEKLLAFQTSLLD